MYGSIEVIWCPTDDMLVDALTKFSLPIGLHLNEAVLPNYEWDLCRIKQVGKWGSVGIQLLGGT